MSEAHNIDGIQVVERSVPLSRGTALTIERQVIDIREMIEKKISDEGIYSIEDGIEETRGQQNFNKKVRLLFKVLRNFPNNPLCIHKLEAIIETTSPPWRILAHLEHIPEQFHPRILDILETYLEENEDDMFLKQEMCNALGVQLQHIACFPQLSWFLQELVQRMPAKIAYQIVHWEYFNDDLEKMLFERSRGFLNQMTVSQRTRFDERLQFHEATLYQEADTVVELPKQRPVSIMQFFPNDDDGYRSFIHFKNMLQGLGFSLKEQGGLYCFTSKHFTFLCNKPESGDQENIDEILFHYSDTPVDICIIRGHSNTIDLNDIVQGTGASVFLIGGCEGSKFIRKDLMRQVERSDKKAIKDTTFIASKTIGRKKINDAIIQGILEQIQNGQGVIDLDFVSSVSDSSYEIIRY